MTLPVIFSAIALFLGALYGLACLFSPTFASNSVRLKADPDNPGGYAEFRATFGGVFLMLHITALVLLLFIARAPDASETQSMILYAFALLPIAMGWFGAAIGRVLSMLLDGKELEGSANNPKLVPLELVFGLAILAPILSLALSK